MAEGARVTTSVAVDELRAGAQLLRLLCREAASMRAHLSAIDGIVSLNSLQAARAPAAAARAEFILDQLDIVLFELEFTAKGLAATLEIVAEGYSHVEPMVADMIRQLQIALGGFGRSLVPALAVVAGVAVLSSLAGGPPSCRAAAPPAPRSAVVPQGALLARQREAALADAATGPIIRDGIRRFGAAPAYAGLAVSRLSGTSGDR